jgi:hypothetical protein
LHPISSRQPAHGIGGAALLLMIVPSRCADPSADDFGSRQEKAD